MSSTLLNIIYIDEYFACDTIGNVVIRTSIFGRIAQLVEQWPFKPMVGGSNPSAPTNEKSKDTLVVFFDFFIDVKRDSKGASRKRASASFLCVAPRLRVGARRNPSAPT